MVQPQIGFIGGSGLYALASLESAEEVNIDTPFGRPSDVIHVGELNGTGVAFLSRHGAGHRLAPSEVPYRANVCAMKMLGVRTLISISAVGSLQEEIEPRSFVIPDNIVDRTTGRHRSFFGDGAVAHVSVAEPFCSQLCSRLYDAAHHHDGSLPITFGGTYVCIEGPQFSTRAESELYRSWGASIIGMTAMPESRLAREAELCYACLAMVTDYDVWRTGEAEVSVELVVENLHVMSEAVQEIVVAVATSGEHRCKSGCRTALEDAIITDPGVIPETTRTRLKPIAGRYLDGQA